MSLSLRVDGEGLAVCLKAREAACRELCASHTLPGQSATHSTLATRSLLQIHSAFDPIPSRTEPVPKTEFEIRNQTLIAPCYYQGVTSGVGHHTRSAAKSDLQYPSLRCD